MEMKQPSLSLTNTTTIAEREIHCHQPQRSHRILEARVRAIGQDCLLSHAKKKRANKGGEGRVFVVAMKDSNIRHVAVGNHYYERTPAGYLAEVTH
jgi:hypothetical protein